MQTLSILQSHYPERLGMAVCYHAPRLFSFSWRVRPFATPLNFLTERSCACLGSPAMEATSRGMLQKVCHWPWAVQTSDWNRIVMDVSRQWLMQSLPVNGNQGSRTKWPRMKAFNITCARLQGF